MAHPVRPDGLSVAFVGVGPRGLSVVERLLARLRSGPGSRRQPEWLTMNATGGEVTVQSPDSDVPGGGLVEWSASTAWPDGKAGPVDYPPRRVYGAYLTDAFARLRATQRSDPSRPRRSH